MRLRDGDTLVLTAMLVRKTVRGHDFVMYGFNGEIPGPLIRVPQNATIIVRFVNQIDLPSAMHWHGVRLDNHSNGVPGLTQEEVSKGGTFVYRVHFPDAGIYWYHPHVREDVEQGMGLFGNMIVDSPDKDYYSPVNREEVLMLDDLLVNGDTLIPFGGAGPDFALMGRVGNELLVNGESNYAIDAAKGEVIRFFVTNVSSSRTYNISFGGAPMKIVASDVSRFEHEAWVTSIVLAPAERYIAEVRFERPGRYLLVNSVQAINHFRGEFVPEVDTLGVVTVAAAPAAPDYGARFAVLRDNAAVSRDIDHYRAAFDRPPDKTLRLTVRVTGLPLATVQFMSVDTAYFAPLEWVDGMPDMNWLSTSEQVRWILRDDASGKENMDIDWHVAAGVSRETPIVQRPHVVPSNAASDPPARSAHAGHGARRRGDAESRVEGHRDHPGRCHCRRADRCVEPRRLDASLPHRRAPGSGDDGRHARRSHTRRRSLIEADWRRAARGDFCCHRARLASPLPGAPPIRVGDILRSRIVRQSEPWPLPLPPRDSLAAH